MTRQKSIAESMIPIRLGRPPISRVLATKWICAAAESLYDDTVIRVDDSIFDAMLVTLTTQSITNHTEPVAEPEPVVELVQEPVLVLEPVLINGIEAEVVGWLSQESKTYLKLAGVVADSGSSWVHRLAQVSCGLSVLARGRQWIGEYLGHVVKASCKLIAAARSLSDLEKISGLIDNLLYLDYLQDMVVEGNGRLPADLPSRSIQACYDDKYLTILE